MKKETKRNVIENSDSKNHDSVKLHSELTNELSNNVKSSKLLCYVCASSNIVETVFLQFKDSRRIKNEIF